VDQLLNGYPIWEWAIAYAFLAAGVLQGVVALLRSGGRRRHDQAIATLCRQRGMLGVGDARTPILPQMIAVDAPACRNTFAAPDWSIWFSEVSDRRGGSALITNSPGPFAVLMFAIPGLNLPYIAVARKGRLQLPPGPPGQSVGLESTEFADRFWIRAEDRRSAVMLIDQGMMRFLLDCDRVGFQITGPIVYAIVNRTDVHSKQAADLELLLQFHDAFAAHVPELVRIEFPAPPDQAEAALAAVQAISNVTPETLASLIAQARTRTPSPPTA
jgi:hypothetical protein